MTEYVKIKKDRVLEASAKCPTAENIFKIMFPEIFESRKKAYKLLARTPDDRLICWTIPWSHEFKEHEALESMHFGLKRGFMLYETIENAREKIKSYQKVIPIEIWEVKLNTPILPMPNESHFFCKNIELVKKIE